MKNKFEIDLRENLLTVRE